MVNQPQAHTGSYYAATVNRVTDYAPLDVLYYQIKDRL